jgi:hypothetical protein
MRISEFTGLFRDSVIYHLSVLRRIDPHWATVASDRRDEHFGDSERAEYVKVKHIASSMKYETSGLRLMPQPHSPIWIKINSSLLLAAA